MREHDALGRAGGAGGVDETGVLIRRWVLHRVRLRLALRQQPLVRARVALRQIQADQRGPEFGSRSRTELILAEHLGVRSEHDLGLAVLQDEGPIFQRLRLVHGHEGRAQAEGRVRGGGPLDPVAGDQRHAIALADAERWRVLRAARRPPA